LNTREVTLPTDFTVLFGGFAAGSGGITTSTSTSGFGIDFPSQTKIGGFPVAYIAGNPLTPQLVDCLQR
jgi:hypothetical protein